VVTTVIYRDNRMGMIDTSHLDGLIFSNKIKQFLRSEGWVTIGRDPIRRSRDKYTGRDRRQNMQLLTPSAIVL
jgi:hypothetical protein